MNSEDLKIHLSDRFRHLFQYWFVQYNPLYFFSALCILFGMFLLSQNFREMGWKEGHIFLALVMQSYELLLISGAALLFRFKKQRRPAVILALMEVFFLFDCTFQIEVWATLDYEGLLLAAGWAVLTVLKLSLLLWTFRLKISAGAFTALSLAAVTAALLPQLISLFPFVKELIHLAAIWVLALLLAMPFRKGFGISSVLPLDDWGHTVLRRASRAALIIWAVFYSYHAYVWMHLFDMTLTFAYLVPFLFLVSLVSRREAVLWTACGAALAVTFLNPPHVSPTALIIGALLLWKGRRLNRKRLYVGSVLTFYLAAWTVGWRSWPLPEENLWLSLLTAVVLLFMFWRFRLYEALLAILLAVVPFIRLFVSLDSLERGILLLATGFIALLLGLAVNWFQKQPRPGKT